MWCVCGVWCVWCVDVCCVIVVCVCGVCVVCVVCGCVVCVCDCVDVWGPLCFCVRRGRPRAPACSLLLFCWAVRAGLGMVVCGVCGKCGGWRVGGWVGGMGGGLCAAVLLCEA